MLVQRYSKLKLVSDFKFGSEWGHLLFQLCYNYEWKSKAVLAIMKKPIWLLQQTTKMKGCTIFKIHFNISDPTPRPILNVHSTQMPPKIADKLWKLLETLPTSLGGWESFGTDLQMVSTIWQISLQEMPNSNTQKIFNYHRFGVNVKVLMFVVVNIKEHNFFL